MAGFYRIPLAYFSISSKYIFCPCAIHKTLPIVQTFLLFHLFVVVVYPQADLTKAVITLQPPWVSVFQEENITLWCEGPHLPGNSSTRWFLNGTAFQTLTPRYRIAAASISDTGEYRCQTGLSVPSDPVRLEIHRGKYGMEQESWKSQGLPLCFLLSGCHMYVFDLLEYV